jgi:hypothetical protein
MNAVAVVILTAFDTVLWMHVIELIMGMAK